MGMGASEGGVESGAEWYELETLVLEFIIHGERFFMSTTSDQSRTSPAVTQLIHHAVDQGALLKVLFLEN